jgi:hypothetical protein
VMEELLTIGDLVLVRIAGVNKLELLEQFKDVDEYHFFRELYT